MENTAEEIRVEVMPFHSPAYKQALGLRERILRKPLGLTFEPEELAKESDYLHLGAFVGEWLVGTMFFVPLDKGIFQMRQVAVDRQMRRKGIGKRMVEFGETRLRNGGVHTIVLNARLTALPFYDALGYRQISGQYFDLGIPHVKMVKFLDGPIDGDR